MKIIARIHTSFKEKFGIPRQSGITDGVAKIIFEPEYRRREAFTGIEGYSHLWLIWQFSEAVREDWSPTVRPPRLGGNKRMGVFATRSPFRPNPIGLSSVKLLAVEYTKEHGPVLTVCGADILDGTPIYDIKPYLAYTDSHPDAVGGFADGVMDYKIEVDFPAELLEKIDTGLTSELFTILENDPRPSYKAADEKEYGMRYADYEIFFVVKEGVLHVTRITEV
jgi:tRNA-Thr(GGU) m(6)t(6)A37 methyltransferase TsaA